MLKNLFGPKHPLGGLEKPFWFLEKPDVVKYNRIDLISVKTVSCTKNRIVHIKNSIENKAVRTVKKLYTVIMDPTQYNRID